VQEAVNFHDVDDLQETFNTASRLVWEQFPKQLDDDSLYKKWGLCQNFIPHGVYLSKKFDDDYARTGIVKGSDYFVRLLSNCAWYLYEVGDYEVAKRMVETAQVACDDKNSLIYGKLLDILGSISFDLNLLSDCRTAWEATSKIRKAKLPHDSSRIAAIYNNLGNIATASGNLDEAKEHYERAMMIWLPGGDKNATYLALTYLCVGRMHMLRGNLIKAEEMTTQAESLFTRTIGPGRGVLANVHFAYGNIQFLHGDKEHYELAKRSYENCLQIGLLEFPAHPITGAAYYSIGCVEFALGHAEAAKVWLDKALQIAELRSPTRDDGPIARIIWKMSVVLASDTYGTYAEEALKLRQRADEALIQLRGSGEGGFIPYSDEESRERDQEEDDFDALVPLFFR